eukprot:bmy_08410T0
METLKDYVCGSFYKKSSQKRFTRAFLMWSRTRSSLFSTESDLHRLPGKRYQLTGRITVHKKYLQVKLSGHVNLKSLERRYQELKVEKDATTVCLRFSPNLRERQSILMPRHLGVDSILLAGEPGIWKTPRECQETSFSLPDCVPEKGTLKSLWDPIYEDIERLINRTMNVSQRKRFASLEVFFFFNEDTDKDFCLHPPLISVMVCPLRNFLRTVAPRKPGKRPLLTSFPCWPCTGTCEAQLSLLQIWAVHSAAPAMALRTGVPMHGKPWTVTVTPNSHLLILLHHSWCLSGTYPCHKRDKVDAFWSPSLPSILPKQGWEGANREKQTSA